MGFLDTLIGIGIVVAFVSIIGSRIYNHEKEHIDPLIKKAKGWFSKDDEEDFLDPNEEFDIAFKGQM